MRCPCDPKIDPSNVLFAGLIIFLLALMNALPVIGAIITGSPALLCLFLISGGGTFLALHEWLA